MFNVPLANLRSGQGIFAFLDCIVTGLDDLELFQRLFIPLPLTSQ